MPRTNWKDMSRYAIAISDSNVAESFTLRISRGVVEKIKCNIMECRPLALIRDALLPKLLSGDLRMDDPEEYLEDHLQ